MHDKRLAAMDLQSTNHDALISSQSEFPANIVDIIISKDFENDNSSQNDETAPEDNTQENINTKSESVQIESVQLQDEKEKEEEKEDSGGRLRDKTPPREHLKHANAKEITPNNETNENDMTTENECETTNEDEQHKKLNSNPQSFGQPTQQNDVDRLWNEALMAQNQGNFKSAIRKFTAILEVRFFHLSESLIIPL